MSARALPPRRAARPATGAAGGAACGLVLPAPAPGPDAVLEYRPAFRLLDGSVFGVEATVGTSGGPAPLEETCRQLARWRDGRPEVPVVASVVLSTAQLGAPDLVARVISLLRHHDIAPEWLCFEVDEGVLMGDPDAEPALRRLRRLGVRLAIAGFGTGASSLSRLRELPVDVLKVDRRFVAGIGTSHVDTAIVRAVLGLASSLEATAIAEGIETQAQLEALRDLGCEVGSGSLWGPSVDADGVADLLARPPAPLGSPPSADVPGDAGGSDEERQVLDLLVHELRTPLAVIRGFAETLADAGERPDPALLRVGLDAIVRQVANIDAMFRNLVDTQALGGVALPLFREDVDLVRLVREVVGDLSLTIPALHVDVELPAGGPPVVAHVDRDRIRQVLTNLIGNAEKFSPPAAPITIRVTTSADEAEVHVIDGGPGIPLGRVPDVFRKFARLDRTVKGNGLGLYIARGISLAHGGELEWRPGPSGGSDFVLRLPLDHGR